VIWLTSSWPWRCVGEAGGVLSRKKAPRVDASATWCWKHPHTTPHTICNILKQLFRFTLRTLHPQLCRPLPASYTVIRASTIQWSLARVVVCCWTKQHRCYVHQPAVQPSEATKQSGLDFSLMPSGVPTEASVYSFRLIHWLRSHTLHPRKTYRLASDGGSRKKCGGEWRAWDEQSLFLF
jgi:hypothetical protein